MLKNKEYNSLQTTRLYNGAPAISSHIWEQIANIEENGASGKGTVRTMRFIEFWKANSSVIVKMFVNQIGMTIFGLMLNMATAANKTLLVVTSLFSILFYMCLLYSVSWDYGARDKIRVDGGRMTRDVWKGIRLSLVANIPNILLALLAIVGYVFTKDFLANDPKWAVDLYAVCNTVARFLHAMYLGVLVTAFPAGENQVYSAYPLILTVIPALFTCGFGYFLGLRGNRILGFMAPPRSQEEIVKGERYDLK